MRVTRVVYVEMLSAQKSNIRIETALKLCAPFRVFFFIIIIDCLKFTAMPLQILQIYGQWGQVQALKDQLARSKPKTSQEKRSGKILVITLSFCVTPVLPSLCIVSSRFICSSWFTRFTSLPHSTL